MRTIINKKANVQGFTLIEMIGVLAVIAILSALLIPKIFEAINNARISNASITCDTVKAALADHYAKWGQLAVNGASGTPVIITVPENHYDKVLLAEGFIDKSFVTKIGDGTTNTTVQLVAALPTGTVPDGVNSAYDLDGDNGAGTPATFKNDAGGTGNVVQAVISNTTEQDARELNNRLDGPLLGTASGADLIGRVKYAAAVGGITTVYVYLTHR
jgi:prepilin-type N-terminal cleavage/methylation domain-containing protein